MPLDSETDLSATIPSSAPEATRFNTDMEAHEETQTDAYNSAAADDGDDDDDYAPTTPKKRPATRNASTPSRSPKTPKRGTGAKEKNSSSKAGPAVKGKWTGDDLEALFRAALGDGPSAAMLDGVAGRSGKLCHDIWTRTIFPYIVACLRDRGGDGRR